MWGIPQTEEKSEMVGGREIWMFPHTLSRGRENERRQWLRILESSTFIIPRFCPLPSPPVAPQTP